MWIALKRLSVGVFLIALASGVLLYSDWSNRRTPSADKSRAKKWRLALVELNNVLDVEQAEHGVLEGLQQAGLVKGRDYEIRIQNAQGDMATVNTLVDNAVSQGADLLITFSSPTLQVALHRVQHLPIVFTYVADGVITGAGRSKTDHLPNVTGVDFEGPFAATLDLVRLCLPKVHAVGTLFVPSEVNSVFQKDQLVEEAGKIGIEVVTVPASTSSEVPDAALALMSRRIDAVLQIGGNLTAAAFSSIGQAARKARVPVFAMQSEQARQGATVVMARDCDEAGKSAALMAARIMRGESPASIPFASVTATRLIINLEAAAAIGLRVPPVLVQQAQEVIR
jgi:ABC-type uncharacterized transport system substrate-binding protein